MAVISGMGDMERASAAPERTPSAADFLKLQLYKTLTFKDLTFDQYRGLLFITLMINFVFFSLQVGRFGYLMVHDDLENDDALTLVIIAFILTSINMAHLVKLMITPTPRVAVSCMGIILLQECVFIAETAAYYNDIVDSDYMLALSIVFLFLQLGTVMVVYRFWELILFNFDGDTWNGGTPSVGNLSDLHMDGRGSTGGVHPSKAKSPIHIDTNNGNNIA
jgi:hypothetical protein